MRTATIIGLAVAILAVPLAGEEVRREYLSELQDRFLSASQGWGELGINTCAHEPGQKGQPLEIAGKRYAKGLGHHASGEITVALDGEYETFEAEVGLQSLPSKAGSVVFAVLVDGSETFNSGLMRDGDPAKPVSVPVKGARELRLVVTDGGDGMGYDCANWASARLTRDPEATAQATRYDLDIAPFARVVTSDPARMDGSRANRVQEYRAEDVFLEQDLTAADGVWTVPAGPDGRRCIGLNWLERRAVRRLAIAFASPVKIDPATVSAQCWSGESSWQGGWVPIEGAIQVQDDGTWVLPIDTRENADARKGTRKVRWVFPAGDAPLKVKRLSAWTPTPVEQGSFELRLGKPGTGRASVTLYNGFVTQDQSTRKAWDLAQPLRLDLTFTRPRQWKADRTIIRVELPDAAFGIAVEDILANDAVYVRDFDLLATTHPAKVTLETYKQRIQERSTVLDRVRSMPDQTLEQAMKAIHNPKQNQHPMMLSLACDNQKYIVHRSGLIQFMPTPGEGTPQVHRVQYTGMLTPQLGAGDKQEVSRHLEGGWLPIPVTTTRAGGLTLTQRTMVVPFDRAEPRDALGWLSPHPLCLAEFEIAGSSDQPVDASVRLVFHSDHTKQELAEVQATGAHGIAHRHGRLLASVKTTGDAFAPIEASDGVITVKARVAAKGSARFSVAIPGWRVPIADAQSLHTERDAVSEIRAYWERVLAPAAVIEVPDPLIMDVIRASQVHCLLAARNEADNARIAAWIASDSYGPLESEAHSIIRGMAALGHREFAERSLDFFINRYDANGMLTTGYTLMGTGWHLWTLAEHVERAKRYDWLRERADKVAKVCDWMARQRAKTRTGTESLPERGLMPPGVMADWNAFAYYFCLNGYYCAGLRDTARVLQAINFPEAPAFAKAAAEFEDDIHRAWRWTQARMPVYPLQDGTWVPGYPSQVHGPGPTADFFPGEDANRSWCYDVELGSHHLVPFGLLDPQSRDVTSMMDHMEDVQFLAEGWFDFAAERNHKDPFNLGGFSKVQPYYSRNAEIHALRDEVRPYVRAYFNTLCSLLNRENLSFQEHFAGVAAWNKTHETGYFLHQTAMMLALERGDALWIAPFVTSNWMREGQGVSVHKLPTRFGPLTYRIHSAAGAGHIDAMIESLGGGEPKEIVVRLRHPGGKPMKAVTVNGQPHKEFDAAREIVRIAGARGEVKVRAEY